MRKAIYVIILILLILYSPGIAGVYFWVDENGVKHYGEEPPSEKAEDAKILIPENDEPEIKKGAQLVQYNDDVQAAIKQIEQYIKKPSDVIPLINKDGFGGISFSTLYNDHKQKKEYAFEKTINGVYMDITVSEYGVELVISVEDNNNGKYDIHTREVIKRAYQLGLPGERVYSKFLFWRWELNNFYCIIELGEEDPPSHGNYLLLEYSTQDYRQYGTHNFANELIMP